MREEREEREPMMGGEERERFCEMRKKWVSSPYILPPNPTQDPWVKPAQKQKSIGPRAPLFLLSSFYFLHPPFTVCTALHSFFFYSHHVYSFYASLLLLLLFFSSMHFKFSSPLHIYFIVKTSLNY